jgi:alpha-glucosidase
LKFHSQDQKRRIVKKNPIVYQVYPRSFQDSNNDGIGDLNGVASRLDYLKWLGVDAIWLSPIFQSPLQDGGYDVSDYLAIDPVFGTNEDFDALVHKARELQLGVLLDIVPCHTSIEHRWFREHPDWYIWHDGDSPPNNWKSVFGGPAWTRDEVSGRWYFHNYYSHQPHLNWRNVEVPSAIANVMLYWLDRGVDGFRMDALQVMFNDEELRDEPPAAEQFSGPAHPDWLALNHVHTLDLPEVPQALKSLAAALPSCYLVAEVYAGLDTLRQYIDAVGQAFCFSLTNVPPRSRAVAEALEPFAQVDGLAWALSNHDLSRIASRWGQERSRIAALLISTLPGACFLYQGDEIGMTDGPGTEPPYDNAGRDAYRHPMQWTNEGGFSDATPWLPMIDPERSNVEQQIDDPHSLLHLYRTLLALRPQLRGGLSNIESHGTLLTYQRGDHLIVINFGAEPCGPPSVSEIVLSTAPNHDDVFVAPFSGFVARL